MYSQQSEDPRAISDAYVRVFLDPSKTEHKAGQSSCLTFLHLFLLFLDMAFASPSISKILALESTEYRESRTICECNQATNTLPFQPPISKTCSWTLLKTFWTDILGVLSLFLGGFPLRILQK